MIWAARAVPDAVVVRGPGSNRPLGERSGESGCRLPLVAVAGLLFLIFGTFRLDAPGTAGGNLRTAQVAAADPSPAGPAAGPVDLAAAAWFQVGDHGDASNTLYVGRLDGRAFEVATNKEGWILASGPVGGKVLAWWETGKETVFILVDTADGSSKELMRIDDSIGYGASLDPSGRYIYWVPAVDDARVRGLFRRPVSGGETEKVLDGWDTDIAVLVWSDDGRWLSIANADGPRTDYRFVDARTGGLAVYHDSGVGDAFGFVGEELVGYESRGDGGELRYPLLALDAVDGTVRTVAEGDGRFAAVIPDAHGMPRLVYDEPDVTGRYTLRVLEDSAGSALLYTADEGWLEATTGDEFTSQLVRPNWWSAVSAAGWVPVFPGGYAYVWPDAVDRFGESRRLVNLDSGAVVPVPAAGDLQVSESGGSNRPR
jgi:hypothetical protein